MARYHVTFVELVTQRAHYYVEANSQARAIELIETGGCEFSSIEAIEDCEITSTFESCEEAPVNPEETVNGLGY
jgi:hypothetical protein